MGKGWKTWVKALGVCINRAAELQLREGNIAHSVLYLEENNNDEENSVEERRRFQRTASAFRVEISHPSFGNLVGFTMDISDGGAQVSIENHPTPPVGTIVNVMFKRVVGPVNAQPVPMKVMHSHRNVIGLMFVGKEP